MSQPLDNRLVAHRAAGDIIHTLNDRKGFDAWWYDISLEFQQEIRDSIAERIYDAIIEAKNQGASVA